MNDDKNFDILPCGHFSDTLGNSCRECIAERNIEFKANLKIVSKVVIDSESVYSKEYRIHNQFNNFEKSIIKRNELARVRAKRAGQESYSSFTQTDIQILLEKQSGECLACYTPFTECVMEVDHKLPLEYGGANDIKNLQLLCKSCNIKKGNKDNAKWISTVRYLQVMAFLEELQEEESYAT